ncbi:MAG: OFA family MFS transporter [Nanoarchaeota archaeon]|nr:OFA family MFS transporter [Nanoarchaeota archaeon]MBU1005671.1 OFA family MFS transporter [Nanoarchaeota archaeon]MBU1946904.1 OFA family MFS transporter [Nanoarchaeota archaeon]
MKKDIKNQRFLRSLRNSKEFQRENFRWIVVIAALVIQLCLGAIYSWSVFVNPLKNSYGYTTTQTQIIFSVALATFALVMIFAGRWQDKAGPRKVAIVGGILLGLGYMLARFTNGSFYGIIATIGIIGGAGIGFGYVCPIAACVKWFPDKRGLITGLAVAGFGAGAWLFAQLAGSLIESTGLLATFMTLGTIFMIAIVASSFFLVNPPDGWVPEGFKIETKKGAKSAKKNDISWQDMIKTKQFWLLWLMFTFGASAGLMVIGNLKPFGVYAGLSAAIAGSAVGILALFNGAGRITWGFVSDKIGRTRSMLIMFLLQGAMMLILMNMGSTGLLLAIASAWVGFNFGGNFALFPSTTADFFGTKNLGINYGLVFTSYGIAGILGPILGGKVFDVTGSYLYAFVPSGILCIIAAGLAFITKKPEAA